MEELLPRNKTCYISLTNTFNKHKVGKWILCYHLIRSMFVLVVLKIVVHLKSSVLESMKYSVNDYYSLFQVILKMKILCLYYYWFLIYSFSNLFFLSQMDTNHIYRWTAISLPEKQCCWLKSLWVDHISSCWLLLNDLFQPPNLPLWPIKTFFRVYTSCCSRPQLLFSLADFLEKQRKSPGRKEASVC